MSVYEIILKKRNKQTLSPEEIRSVVREYTEGHIPDYQMSALLMAIFFNGMNFEETTQLTLAMRDSGVVVDLSSVPGVKVDKHSTGGVGDKISLMLAPLAASLGVVVPMISGRGLGHTGGTLDKLESIPGFKVDLPIERFIATLKKIGVCMIGQTGEIAPADKKLYALRDVTGTVESIPLISASIMSKKLAEGIDALVLDVKVGSGAFMKTYEQAVDLAQHLVAIGEGAGKSVVAVLTDMNQPLGNAVGNWLEMKESIDVLQGRGPKDIIDLTVTLTAFMVLFSQKNISYEAACELCRQNLNNGRAFEKFIEMVDAHSGDVSVIKNPDMYPVARFAREVQSTSDGYIQSIDSFEIGLTGILIGAGRQTKEDPIDYTAGIIIHKKTGDPVRRGEALATIYTNKETILEEAARRVLGAYKTADFQPVMQPLVLATLDKHGIKTWK